MLAKLNSMVLSGIEAIPVKVEIDVQGGLPAVEIVGLASTSVKEARERVRSAIKNSGYDFPNRRIVVNLSPADMKKEGSHFDLPIALGILLASGQIENSLGDSCYMAGELSLYGNLQKIAGVLPMALELARYKGPIDLLVQALLQSERKYMSILNTCPNEIAITTIEEGRFIDVNFQACKTLGLSYDEIVGHTSQELELWVNPQDRVELVNLLKQTGLVKNQEYTMWVHNGREITALVSAEIWDFDGTQCMILIINDISEKKKMENELARLEQLNLIGEMAASIGHEVRNPMTSVRGFLQLLKDKPQFELYNEYFNLMIEELDCANHIITEFLSMARHKNVDLRLSNLNAIILSAVPSIRAEVLAQNKELELQLNPIDDLMLDHNEIRQLLYNLSRNALESMAPGKKVIIKTYGKDNQVILAVKDQGSGIPKNIINKIGVPFFTTKEKGNGLGLAVSYSIAARHQGSIQLETSPSGTTFFVSFPLPEASLAGPE
jgi:two-component system, sporulation sensor kinase E